MVKAPDAIDGFEAVLVHCEGCVLSVIVACVVPDPSQHLSIFGIRAIEISMIVPCLQSQTKPAFCGIPLREFHPCGTGYLSQVPHVEKEEILTSGTSTISRRNEKGRPSCSRCTVHATKARWFGDVHASVAKLRAPR